MKKLILAAIVFFIFIGAVNAQDFIKLKVLPRATKCKIIEANDTLVVYSRINTSQILMARLLELDWYVYGDGRTFNLGNEKITQADLDNAVGYSPRPITSPKNDLQSETSDIVKLIDLDHPLKCYIIQEQDSSIVFQRLDNNDIITAKFSDLDYYILRTGEFKNISNRQIIPAITQSVQPAAEPSSNPDKRTSLTIFTGGSTLSGDWGSLMDEFYLDDLGNLQYRTIQVSQERASSDFHFGGSLLIPAGKDVSIIMNLSYRSTKMTAPEDLNFYGFEEKLNGFSFGAAIKIYLSR